MNIKWNSDNYRDNFSFVPQYGEAVMELITAPAGSRVVDLGCGNGALTEKLAEKGYDAVGVDASEDMIKLARTERPHLTFVRQDALAFSLDKKADVIFSNAVFHWIDACDQDKLIENVARNLKDSGELVCEFGGCGCAERVHSALDKIFGEHGLKYPRVFYFPTIGEYAPMLEKHGLRVEFAALFDRPTPQRTQDGLVDWINMFVTAPFEGMEPGLKNEILSEARERLRGDLCVDGKWYIDYVRIRIKARKIGV